MRSTDLTKAGDFKKGTAILKKIDSLVYAYQAKCDSMQIDLNNYSGSVRKAGCNPCYNRVKTLSLPHEAMASITNRIP